MLDYGCAASSSELNGILNATSALRHGRVHVLPLLLGPRERLSLGDYTRFACRVLLFLAFSCCWPSPTPGHSPSGRRSTHGSTTAITASMPGRWIGSPVRCPRIQRAFSTPTFSTPHGLRSLLGAAILQGAWRFPAYGWAPGGRVVQHGAHRRICALGLGFARLVHRDTGSWMAGVVAGSAVAFNAHHLVRIAHIQALHLELVPLVFLAIDRLLVTGRKRYAALLGVALALQATASIYLLVFTGWAVSAGGWRGCRNGGDAWRDGPGALVAGATCALLLLPVLWPYVELARTQGMVGRTGETQRCAATWTDYLYTGSRVHYDAWSYRFRDPARTRTSPA